MKLLFVILVTVIGSAIADDETKWVTKRVLAKRELFTNSAASIPSVPTLIADEGYPVEIHQVATEDGYILTMHRIPGSPVSPEAAGKPIVFVMHGLLSSSADWIIMGPGNGLGYILADAGYDVWMGNARGNTYSKAHTQRLNDEDFWNFSWHEIGVYDLPAMIDYVLENTGQERIFYIGHSQGTTSFYVMASTRTEYNDKIEAMFSLAPVAYMGHVTSPVPRFASLGTTILSVFLRLVGVHEFLPSDGLIGAAGAVFCNDDDISQILCRNSLFLLCGFNRAQLNTTMLPIILQYTPAGAATRQIAHYGQEITSGRFRQYDHGIGILPSLRNLRIYGRLTPPDYDLSLVTAPVHLVYSDNDWMAAVEDVEQLYDELGNPIEMRRVLDEKWNHLDYLWGIDAKILVYDNLVATMQKYAVINDNRLYTR